MNVKPSGNTREPRRGMIYRRKHGDGHVQIIRVYPWGRGHRVRFQYEAEPDVWREESLTCFRRGFVKQEKVATCTPITARWCPICGTCKCRGDGLGDDLNNSACPLHAPESPHGEPFEEEN